MESKNWLNFARYLINTYGILSYIDSETDDNVVYCPECGEPIYEEDYPVIGFSDNMGQYICPICENEL